MDTLQVNFQCFADLQNRQSIQGSWVLFLMCFNMFCALIICGAMKKFAPSAARSRSSGCHDDTTVMVSQHNCFLASYNVCERYFLLGHYSRFLFLSQRTVNGPQSRLVSLSRHLNNGFALNSLFTLDHMSVALWSVYLCVLSNSCMVESFDEPHTDRRIPVCSKFALL